LEVLASDLEVVMEAAWSKRAAIFASGDNGLLAMLFAASHPDRVSSLVLYDSTPTFLRRDDMPWQSSLEDLERERERRRGWGTRGFARWGFEGAGPSVTDDDQEFEW
jgi:pimeloyl-ACP methyl ester carboxylesterase